jgi:hypothetical protein
MVIEHTFITTMEAPEALSAASNFLQSGGFQVMNNSAFQMGGWTDLEVARGRASPARAKDVTQYPQQVRIEWDRGRVNVAASVTQRPRKEKRFMWSGRASYQAGPLSGAPPKDRAYADLMLVITRGLEILLAQRLSPQEAAREWFAVETQMRDEARRARNRSIAIGVAILVLFIGLIIFAAIMASRS